MAIDPMNLSDNTVHDWYISDKGEVRGPWRMTNDSFRSFSKSIPVRDDIFIWNEDMSNWMDIKHFNIYHHEIVTSKIIPPEPDDHDTKKNTGFWKSLFVILLVYFIFKVYIDFSFLNTFEEGRGLAHEVYSTFKISYIFGFFTPLILLLAVLVRFNLWIFSIMSKLTGRKFNVIAISILPLLFVLLIEWSSYRSDIRTWKYVNGFEDEEHYECHKAQERASRNGDSRSLDCWIDVANKINRD